MERGRKERGEVERKSMRGSIKINQREKQKKIRERNEEEIEKN